MRAAAEEMWISYPRSGAQNTEAGADKEMLIHSGIVMTRKLSHAAEADL